MNKGYEFDMAANHYRVLGLVEINNVAAKSILSFKLIDNGDGSNITEVYLRESDGKEYVMTTSGKLFAYIYKIILPVLSLKQGNNQKLYEGLDMRIYLYMYNRKTRTWNNIVGAEEIIDEVSDEDQEIYTNAVNSLADVGIALMKH